MEILKEQAQPQTIFAQTSIIPVLVVNDLHNVLPLAKALMDKGLHVLEITLRTPVALEAIRLIREQFPEITVGAGTVLSPQLLQECLHAGAQFAISPGATTAILQAGMQSSIPFIPGVANVSDIMEAMEWGYRFFKFFPAEASGGVAALKAFAGPFPDLRFCPTGGIDQSNFQRYLDLENVSCVGGSWVVPEV